MPPSLAAIITLLISVALLVRDGRQHRDSSAALWLPTVWLWITGSRFVSQWLNLGVVGAETSVTEGTPIDATFFSLMILAGFIVLARRQFKLAAFLSGNSWLVALLLFGMVSILWSDFPLIAAKRWIKTLGHPIMALIILSDHDPKRALGIVLRRCAFVLLPFSVLFIKYFPEFGRGFDPWTGTAFNTGVGLTKNDLGYVCMVLGIFLIWRLLGASVAGDKHVSSTDRLIDAGLLAMVCWLLSMANSATSLATLTVGAITLLVARWEFINRRHMVKALVLALMFGALIQVVFDPYSSIVAMLGRDPDLTDRTEVWADAIALQPNVLLGAGFESFWLGERLDALWAKWWWQPAQAHNGFIETYLNLGVIGVALLLGVIISVLKSISRQLQSDYRFAQYRLAALLAIVAFNYTEAAFKGVHLVWTVFYIVAISSTSVGAPAEAKLPASARRSSRRMRPGLARGRRSLGT